MSICTFHPPVPTKVSDLKNDGLFVVHRSYKLSDLTSESIKFISGNIITNITLNITSIYSNSTFEITTDTGKVLFSKDINDPTLIGTYSTDLWYQVSNEEVELIVNFDYTGIGDGTLEIEYCEMNKDYEELLTANEEVYNTYNKETVEVPETI